MRIALVLTPPTDQHLRWAAQVGVTDFVSRYPAHYGLDPVAGLETMQSRAASFGLRLSVVEGYLPITRIIRGQPGREEQVQQVIALLRRMGELGVQTLCYNFMPSDDWTRTSLRIGARGGATTNGFDARELATPAQTSQPIAAEALWDNLGWFLKRIVPVAEDAGVKLAMHPDDPPLPTLGPSPQIMHSPESFARLFHLCPSPVNGMCFCQGTFAEMNADLVASINRFGGRIHYVHFRDVRGRADQFVETFHDDGQSDMPAAMRAYHAIGFTGPMRPDHVPRLDGEADEAHGYTMLGRLFAVGYMRGLMHAVAGKPG